MDKALIHVLKEISVKSALKQLNKAASKVLFVVTENNELLGALSDGDIRRYILADGDLDNSIDGVYNESPFCLKELPSSKDELLNIFATRKIEVIPIIDKDKRIIELISINEVLEDKNSFDEYSKCLECVPVIIMAGGKGTRLKPFTDVLPKPLVPIQDKPIMDWIIAEFRAFGAKQFYATLNYRGKMIEAYYSSIEKDYNMGFKWEKDFYGTAGSLKLLSSEIEDTFIVSNCDIIVKANYEDVFNFHKESGAKMTVVSSIQHHQIPYGVMEFGDGGVVSKINEKPEYTHAINTGVYVLEKECLDLIPQDEFYHITQLMESLIEQGDKVVTYPVNEKEYIDIGQWEEYMNAVENFNF